MAAKMVVWVVMTDTENIGDMGPASVWTSFDAAMAAATDLEQSGQAKCAWVVEMEVDTP